MLQGAGHLDREAEVPMKETRPTAPTDTHATERASSEAYRIFAVGDRLSPVFDS
jgi:hypothetical protein